MNQIHVEQIFSHYIDRFDYLNTGEHTEYYKWQVCKQYKPLMDQALATDDEHFAKALYEVRKITSNIIDNYTRPFAGLVEYAELEPATVRQMFADLYVPDNGDLDVRMDKIKTFLDKCTALVDKYFPGSFMYQQNSHSVSSYLFLYDPDNHYMYKAEEAHAMADCIEFYDDWGTGDNINLHVYHRMCEQLLGAIKSYPEVLAVNRTRFEGAYGIDATTLHDDSNLHLLLFDIIWCCKAYNLFSGITFNRPTTKEKKLLIENKSTATTHYESYLKAYKQQKLLDEALDYLTSVIKIGDTVTHKQAGDVSIVDITRQYITLTLPGSPEPKRLGLAIVIANGIVRFNVPDFDKKGSSI